MLNRNEFIKGTIGKRKTNPKLTSSLADVRKFIRIKMAYVQNVLSYYHLYF